jgi:hypothetical protein
VEMSLQDGTSAEGSTTNCRPDRGRVAEKSIFFCASSSEPVQRETEGDNERLKWCVTFYHAAIVEEPETEIATIIHR